MRFANLLTGGMDVVAVVLALAFTYSWGFAGDGVARTILTAAGAGVDRCRCSPFR